MEVRFWTQNLRDLKVRASKLRQAIKDRLHNSFVTNGGIGDYLLCSEVFVDGNVEVCEGTVAALMHRVSLDI